MLFVSKKKNKLKINVRKFFKYIKKYALNNYLGAKINI